MKDLRYAPPKYDYTEDEVKKVDCVGDQYGPLGSVTTHTETTDWCILPFTLTRSVGRYGAEYVVLEMPTNPKGLQIQITGGADFSYRIVPVRGSTYLRVYNGNTNPFIFTRPSSTGKWTKLAILVVGGATGGTYTITLPNPLNGTWNDNHGFTWTIEGFVSSEMTMTTIDPSMPKCGTYSAPIRYNACTFNGDWFTEVYTATLYIRPSWDIPFCQEPYPAEWCCTLYELYGRMTNFCTMTLWTNGTAEACRTYPSGKLIPGPMCNMPPPSFYQLPGPYNWTFTKQNCP